LGYNVSVSETQIIPLIAGPEDDTRVLRDALEAHGVMGAVFCAPATPRNRSLVRLCIHSGLENDDIDQVLEACLKIRDQVRPDRWPAGFMRKPAARSKSAFSNNTISISTVTS
jgi:CAI-1 autoinducer synthase